LFSHSCNSGMDDLAADKAAWAGLCEEWPELKKYDGPTFLAAVLP